MKVARAAPIVFQIITQAAGTATVLPLAAARLYRGHLSGYTIYCIDSCVEPRHEGNTEMCLG